MFSACKVAFINRGKTDNVKPNKLYKYIIDNELKYNTLSLKFSATLGSGEEAQTFSGNIRMKKDSIIWVSLRSYNIEGARVCLTIDSIKFINRLDNTYYLGDFSYMAEKFDVDLDYNIIQSIITNSFFFYPTPQDSAKAVADFKPCYDSTCYCMSSVSDRKYSRFFEDDKNTNRIDRKLEKELKDSIDNKGQKNNYSDFIYQIVKVMPEIYRINDIYIENYIQQQSMFISYADQYQIDGQYFPNIISIELLTPKFATTLVINIESVSFDKEEMSYPFKITDKYQEIQLK